MDMATKHAILKDHLERYLDASKEGKHKILNHVCAVTGYPRKSAIRRFRTIQTKDTATKETRGRPALYTQTVEAALMELHVMANRICAERVHPEIAHYIQALQLHNEWGYDAETTDLLLRMSLGSAKARLSGVAKAHGRKNPTSTKPSELKEIIPIRSGRWDDPHPGTGELDTAAHCGGYMGGNFAYTAQYTDIAIAGWTVLCAQWGKGEAGTMESIDRMRRRLPWTLIWLDPDSGSEFIHWHLVRWGKKYGIKLTRSQPYKKNDHARIEQKNYTNIRQFVGYYRYDDIKHVALLNKLYDVLEDYINFFLPSTKTVEKTWIENTKKCKRKHDNPQTPYHRALAHPKISNEIKEALRAKYATLNPKALKRQIDLLAAKLRKTCGRIN